MSFTFRSNWRCMRFNEVSVKASTSEPQSAKNSTQTFSHGLLRKPSADLCHFGWTHTHEDASGARRDQVPQNDSGDRMKFLGWTGNSAWKQSLPKHRKVHRRYSKITMITFLGSTCSLPTQLQFRKALVLVWLFNIAYGLVVMQNNSGASIETCAPTKIHQPYPTSAGCPPSKLHLATPPQAWSHSRPIQVVKHVVRSLNDHCKWMQLISVGSSFTRIEGPTLVDFILMSRHIGSHSHFTSFHQATLYALAPVHLLAEPPAASLPSVAQGVDASHHPWPRIWSMTETEPLQMKFLKYKSYIHSHTYIYSNDSFVYIYITLYVYVYIQLYTYMCVMYACIYACARVKINMDIN